MPKTRVLIIDADNNTSKNIMAVADPAFLADFSIYSANHPDAALELLEMGHTYEIFVLDILFSSRDPHRSNDLNILTCIQTFLPHSEIIIYSTDDNVNFMTKARSLGASGIYMKQQCTLTEMLNKLGQSRSRIMRRSAENTAGAALAASVGAIFRSPKMLAVYNLAATLRQAHALSVLITGPTGSGKEQVAQAVGSGRQVFLALNCATLPETLLESELFGHERGAFTGAMSRKIGIFESADGGTIFLDEVGTLSRRAQESLLRVLQSGEIKRLGSQSTIKVDVQVISATNEDLLARTRTGSFREDLYERLAANQIRVPPLADRSEDIEMLARHFIKKSAKPALRIDASCLRWLCQQNWPRNVRQLENVMTSMVHTCMGEEIHMGSIPLSLVEEILAVKIEPLTEDLTVETPEVDFEFKILFGEPLETVMEKCCSDYITETARKHGPGLSIRSLAELLQIPYSKLQRKLLKYDLVIERIVGPKRRFINEPKVEQ